jgi:hypothetical protein
VRDHTHAAGVTLRAAAVQLFHRFVSHEQRKNETETKLILLQSHFSFIADVGATLHRRGRRDEVDEFTRIISMACEDSRQNI